MTTNQAIALLFPLLTVAVLWIFAIVIRQKVARRRIDRRHAADDSTRFNVDQPEATRRYEELQRDMRGFFEEIDRVAQRALKKTPAA